MTKSTAHPHPKPAIYRLQQIIGGITLGLIGLLVPLLAVIALITGSGNFILIASLLGLLALPIVLYLSATPPVEVSEAGILIQPYLWPNQLIRWEDVVKVQPYTLLPQPNNETTRRALVGRKKYRQAEGLMFIVTGLPVPYRIAGFFAGTQGKPMIAVTNRTHHDYDQLVRRIEKLAPDGIWQASENPHKP